MAMSTLVFNLSFLNWSKKGERSLLNARLSLGHCWTNMQAMFEFDNVLWSLIFTDYCTTSPYIVKHGLHVCCWTQADVSRRNLCVMASWHRITRHGAGSEDHGVLRLSVVYVITIITHSGPDTR